MAGSSSSHDLVVVGSGFASVFFLHRYLETAPDTARVLVLEAGERHDHRWYVDHRHDRQALADDHFDNATPHKPWVFTMGVGGGSNCWWACTPRMLPEDFELFSRFGHGRDWPIGYDELEPYYCDAEQLLQVSGSTPAPYPMSTPFPLPEHRLSPSEELLRTAYPGEMVAQPCARPSTPVEGPGPSRGQCCASGTCGACPIDVKFTILNGIETLADDRVTLSTGSTAVAVEHTAGVATGVRYRRDGQERVASAALVAIGANALFNPFLLARSGLAHDELGRGLVEQASSLFEVDLDGVDSFTGSTSITGHGYMLHRPERRTEKAAGLLEFHNVPPRLRDLDGRWLEKMYVKIVFEDLRDERNRVDVSAGLDRPQTIFEGTSAYTDAAKASARADLAEVLEPLPVEAIHDGAVHPTESHVLGTAVMGDDPATSITDADLRHHEVRNLLVLGGSAFPTAAPANPTLTICALSLRAADRLR